MHAAARSNDARARMVKAADQLFRAQGLHATGVAEILERSGAPRGSLYHYFPGGKEQLAVEAIGYAAARFCHSITQAIEVNDGSLPEAVRLYGGAVAQRLLDTDFVEGCPIGNSAVEGSVGSPVISAACDRAFRDFADVMAEHLAEEGLERPRRTTSRRSSCRVWRVRSSSPGSAVTPSRSSTRPNALP